MDDLSLPIAQQPRLVLLLPIVFMAGAALCASLVWFVTRSLGSSPTASGLAALLCLLLGIAAGIWAMASPQGTIRFRAPDTLEVDARWRGPLRLSLRDARVRHYVWRRGRPSMLVGVYVEVADSTARTTIGSADIELAQAYQASGTEPTTIPPSLMLKPAEFRALLELLPAPGTRDQAR